MWARYSSAQFDQGSGRHACNNPYNHVLDCELFEKMQSTGFWNIQHKDFLDLIAPSFTGVEDAEDMAAILARTHVIVLTENGVYYRVASTEKGNVDFIAWQNPQMKDILAPEYKPIFEAYKADPQAHVLPEGYHADSIWSQELLRKLLRGEPVARTITVRQRGLFDENVREMQEAPRLLPTAESALQVKREKVNHVWKHLKRCPVTTVIELDSPSPAKRVRPSAPASSLPSLPAMPSCPVMNPGNAELGLLEHEEQEAIDLENDMVSFMDEIDGMPPVGEGPDED